MGGPAARRLSPGGAWIPWLGWQVVYGPHLPLVHVLQQLADADERVDPDGEEGGGGAEVLDPWQQGGLQGLAVQQAWPGGQLLVGGGKVGGVTYPGPLLVHGNRKQVSSRINATFVMSLRSLYGVLIWC